MFSVFFVFDAVCASSRADGLARGHRGRGRAGAAGRVGRLDGARRDAARRRARRRVLLLTVTVPWSSHPVLTRDTLPHLCRHVDALDVAPRGRCDIRVIEARVALVMACAMSRSRRVTTDRNDHIRVVEARAALELACATSRSHRVATNKQPVTV